MACGEEGPKRETTPAGSLVAVRELRVGAAIDSEGVVVAPVDSFGSPDTVYASLAAEGHVDKAILTARWTRSEDILMAERQEVFPLAGRMVVTFRLTEPDGLPPDEYQVEIQVGSQAVGSETFHVVGPASVENPEQEQDR